MLDLPTLLSKGYLPRELPPPFNSKLLGDFALKEGSNSTTYFQSVPRAKPLIYNLARTGTLRRELTVFNPIHYLKLGTCVVKNWPALEQITGTSKLSLSRPVDNLPNRAIERAVAA